MLWPGLLSLDVTQIGREKSMMSELASIHAEISDPKRTEKSSLEIGMQVGGAWWFIGQLLFFFMSDYVREEIIVNGVCVVKGG
jgi:hypothetical protein